MEKEEEKKIMSIVNENGETEEVEVILAFEFKDNKKGVDDKLNMLYKASVKEVFEELKNWVEEKLYTLPITKKENDTQTLKRTTHPQ